MASTDSLLLTTSGFHDFLVRAKVSTYASDAAKKQTLEDGAEELTYSEGNVTYRDRYYGSLLFSGQEVVFLSGRPVWSMIYYGYATENREPGADVIQILKSALRAVKPEAPFRGPADLEQGSLHYACRWKGSVAQFEGEEVISRAGRTELRLVFSGGAVK